jgi:tRNA 2-selenouridine synthase
MTDLRRNSTQFLNADNDVPILDVRSPAEYMQGHIPGSHSFPMFSNEERAEVGTLYKQEGRQAAVLRGLEIVGPKMANFIKTALEFKADHFRVYCWRGGMRSESMAWLLRQYGFSTHVLHGGYKAFRNHVLSYFNQPFQLRVITGHTGSSKTMLLKMLANKGQQVIDLEGIANHQGSSFGRYKEGYKPDTEHFQNLLFDVCKNFDLNAPIWIEDESKRVGQVSIPDGLFRQMQESPRYEIEMSLEDRLEHLIAEYGQLSTDQLIEATLAIRKKLGFDQADLAVKCIESGDLRGAAQIILTYYDKRYQQSMEIREGLIRGKYLLTNSKMEKVADQLIQSTYAI